MRRIIDGLLYDTDKAEKICSRVTKDGIFETLSRTKKENWFLVYTVYSGNKDYGYTQVSKKDIAPLGVRDTLNWLKKHGFVDELQRYFPEEIEEA